jgi:aspartyl aminopeptidase
MHVLAGLPQAPETATRFLQFVNASPTPFHAVHNAALLLEKAGFRKVGHHPLHSHTVSPLNCRRLGKETTGRLTCIQAINITSRGELLYSPIRHLDRFTVPYLPCFFRNQSSLLAFTIPRNWKRGAGFSIVATHVDSPNLRVYLPSSVHSP